MKELTISLKKQLTEAHKQIVGGIESMAEGCKLFVAVLDQDRDGAIAFMKSKGVPTEMLDLMESVGRGRIHPRLMFMPGPGPERLQRAPFHEQERLLNVGVEVARIVGDEIKTMVKPVAELTRSEAEIALDSGGNSSLQIQEERLKQRMLSKTFKLPPYSLDGDTLLARENCRIPFAELERIYSSAKEAHQAKVGRLEADLKKRQIAR
jgi:hypothetical protein